VRKGGHVERRAITDQAVLMRLRFLAKQAGVKRLTPHDLRRSFVGELLDAGADISSVQGLAGHSSTNTPSRYDRRPEDATRPLRRIAARALRQPAAAGGGRFPDCAAE